VGGGWFGFSVESGVIALVTAILGAIAAGNIALIAVSLARTRFAPAAEATAVTGVA
jgi:hypothetical protein